MCKLDVIFLMFSFPLSFICVFLSLHVLVYICFLLCVNYFVYFEIYILEMLYICLGSLLAVLQVGIWVCIILPSHTHIAHCMSGALHPGLSSLELEGIV